MDEQIVVPEELEQQVLPADPPRQTDPVLARIVASSGTAAAREILFVETPGGGE